MKPPKKTKLNPTLDPKSPANVKKTSKKNPDTPPKSTPTPPKLITTPKKKGRFTQLSLNFGDSLPKIPPRRQPISTPTMPAVHPKKRFSLLGFLWRWLISPVLAIVIVFHLLVAGLLGIWKNHPVGNSMFMVAHRLNGGTVNQKWVDYENIAKSAKQAVIASEDGQFIYHNGFDFDSIEKAIKKNEKLGKIQAGGSTISQQLAKNLFLTSHRSYLRKGEEAIITLMIEKMWDKKRILEVYLNVVELGDGIYGIESASWHYFGKPARELTNAQSALLASMLTNPKYYQNNLDNPHLKKKQGVILKRLDASPLPP